MSKKIYNRDIEESITAEEKSLDEKQRWVQRMIKSAKHHHKICPYFDKKTQMCFLKLGSRCDRDGKFDICPVFKQFIENKYDEYKSKGKPLPINFADLVTTIF